MWDRHVIDEKLKWGHAVWCADLDGDGDDELIIGVRDNLSKNPGERCGLMRVYKAVNALQEGKWERHILDDGGIAVEDLTGRRSVRYRSHRASWPWVAATHNVRIYRNTGK